MYLELQVRSLLETSVEIKQAGAGPRPVFRRARARVPRHRDWNPSAIRIGTRTRPRLARQGDRRPAPAKPKPVLFRSLVPAHDGTGRRGTGSHFPLGARCSGTADSSGRCDHGKGQRDGYEQNRIGGFRRPIAMGVVGRQEADKQALPSLKRVGVTARRELAEGATRRATAVAALAPRGRGGREDGPWAGRAVSSTRK